MSNFVTNVTSDAVNNMYGNANANNGNYAPKKSFNPNNYLNTSLAKGEKSRKIRIRFLPISSTCNDPFVKIKTHSLKVDQNIAKSGFKTYVCLNSPNLDNEKNEKCPLCAKGSELYQMAKATNDAVESKSIMNKAKEFFSKETYIARVIERGKENEGPKFWRFNARTDKTDPFSLIQEIYNTRKEEAAELGETDYNIFDLNNGKDLYLTITPSSSGNGVTISVSDSGNRTPISDDVDLANSWIMDDKIWRDMYGIKNAEYLSIIADGLIPYWDKDNMKYIGKSPEEFSTTNKTINKEELANEIRKETIDGVFAVASNEPMCISSDEITDELPF